MALPDAPTVHEDRDRLTATAVVDAPAAAIFDYLRQPANHQAISGDGTVRGVYDGPQRLELASRFGLRMRVGVPYRVHSTVVEFEPDRVIAWQHFGGHVWRWTLGPIDDGHTTVSETFDLSTSRFPAGLRVIGYPARHRTNITTSLANLKRLVEQP
ncbi:MAG: SRPBCC family protein [Ilumatobacteraceae bacterium]